MRILPPNAFHLTKRRPKATLHASADQALVAHLAKTSHTHGQWTIRHHVNPIWTFPAARCKLFSQSINQPFNL